MKQVLVIAAGGSLGAISRFWLANAVYSIFGREFPHGTLFINVSGSFLMGFLTEVMLQRFPLSIEYRAAILIGFLGAYTTFSSFAIETYYLIEQGAYLKATANILLSVLLCIGAVWIGLIWARTLFDGDQISWTAHEKAYWGLAIAWGILFIFTTGIAITSTYQDWSSNTQIILWVLILGMASVSTTLWMTFHLSSIEAELGELFTLFTLNALFGGSAIWAASKLGNWICRLYLLPS